MTKSKVKTRTIAVLILVLVFSFSPFMSMEAEAFLGIGDIVLDPANLAQTTITAIGTKATAISTAVSAVADTALVTKEFGLDTVAYQIVNMIIEKLAAETVTWINGGFQGSPAYVTNPQAYFSDLGSKAAGQYIFSDRNLNFLCSPIRARIRIALSRAYLQQPTWKCTLDDVYGNMDDFMGDFDAGGWDKFVQLTQNQQNNPIGAYIQAENELFKKVESDANEKLKELDWGQGIKSFKRCTEWGDPPVGYISTYPGCSLEPIGPGGARVSVCDNAPEAGKVCLKYDTATPGSVIQTQLNDVLGIGNEKLAVADEINEIISALLNQLTKKIVGGIGKGLSGLSKPDSADSGKIFTNLLSTPTKDALIEQHIKDSKTTHEAFIDVMDENPFEPPTPSYPPSDCDPFDSFCILCQNNPEDPRCTSLTP